MIFARIRLTISLTFQRLLCCFGGHDPVAAQVDHPDFDHCVWCKKPMPGRAPGRDTEGQR